MKPQGDTYDDDMRRDLYGMERERNIIGHFAATQQVSRDEAMVLLMLYRVRELGDAVFALDETVERHG